MATHSSVLAWRIPGIGEPGRLLSMGLHRVRHDWSDLAAATSRDMPFSCSKYLEMSACKMSTEALISQASKIILKILQTRLQQYVH